MISRGVYSIDSPVDTTIISFRSLPERYYIVSVAESREQCFQGHDTRLITHLGAVA